MDTELARIATKGSPEMAFWPVVAAGYLFATTIEARYLVVFLVTLLPAAIAYYELNRLKKIIRKLGKRKGGKRWRQRSRREAARKMYEEILSPTSKIQFIGYCIAVLNLVIAAGLYFSSVAPRAFSGNTDLILLTLVALPLIYFSVVGWIFTNLWFE